MLWHTLECLSKIQIDWGRGGQTMGIFLMKSGCGFCSSCLIPPQCLLHPSHHSSPPSLLGLASPLSLLFLMSPLSLTFSVHVSSVSTVVHVSSILLHLLHLLYLYCHLLSLLFSASSLASCIIRLLSLVSLLSFIIMSLGVMAWNLHCSKDIVLKQPARKPSCGTG